MDYFETIALLEQQLHLRDMKGERKLKDEAKLLKSQGKPEKAQKIFDFIEAREKERREYDIKGAKEIASDLKNAVIDNKDKIMSKIPVVSTVNKNVNRYNRLKELLGKFR